MARGPGRKHGFPFAAGAAFGRAASTSGYVTKPRGHEIGLTGFTGPIRDFSLTGSYVMATAEHREPYESRGSRAVLGAPGGESPPGVSTNSTVLRFFSLGADLRMALGNVAVSGRMIVLAFKIEGNHRYSWIKNERSPFVSWTRLRTFRRSTVS
jgi:hypothetical protein